MKEKRSSRFEPNLLTEKVVPVLFGLLLLILLAVMVVVGLSSLGISG